MARITAHLNAIYHSGGDSVVLGIAPASPTSWDLGPRLRIRFGVGGTLNSMKQRGGGEGGGWGHKLKNVFAHS